VSQHGIDMLRLSIIRVVDFSIRHGFWVIALILALALGSAVDAMRHFAIKTDVTDLFPPDLPWTRHARDFMQAFPQPGILVAVDAPTPEFAEEASNKLAHALTGRADLIQSTLTRAVIFSAMTTATGFGSLWLSNDPGTSSMGRLMALALICTMAAAVFFQPALMGPPRTRPSRSEPAFEPPQEAVPSRRPEAEMIDR
jgi:predicted RND superfamily exporter protein